MKLKSIDQQVVAVVGASSGIGRETALQFAKRRAKFTPAADQDGNPLPSEYKLKVTFKPPY